MASSQVGEMRKYDMERDQKYDTELSHLHLERKKRPSYWKHLNKTANPRRVAADLLPTAFNSSGRRVKCSSSSSDVHVRFIHFSFCLFVPPTACVHSTFA